MVSACKKTGGNKTQVLVLSFNTVGPIIALSTISAFWKSMKEKITLATISASVMGDDVKVHIWKLKFNRWLYVSCDDTFHFNNSRPGTICSASIKRTSWCGKQSCDKLHLKLARFITSLTYAIKPQLKTIFTTVVGLLLQARRSCSLLIFFPLIQQY